MLVALHVSLLPCILLVVALQSGKAHIATEAPVVHRGLPQRISTDATHASPSESVFT
jgi:hypothetical protein